ncbi:hypothetical protein J6590_052791 [Homalodisca vitripennis]|nr:hypothetical protein J6590_052791 [Homalodisca vitripennis]
MGDQELNFKLVAEVEKYEVLYNYKLPGYSRKDITDKAWHEIGVAMNMTVVNEGMKRTRAPGNKTLQQSSIWKREISDPQRPKSPSGL